MGMVCGKTPKVGSVSKQSIIRTELTLEDTKTFSKPQPTVSLKPRPLNFDSDYTLQGPKIGQGQYASVQRAVHQRAVEAQFAVKTMRRAVEDLDRQSAREAETWRMIDHPFIAKYYETFEDCGRVRHLLELCEGPNVVSKLGYPPSMSEPDARSVILQLVLAVRYLHLQGISHRDIKPENIVYKHKESPSNGWVKLVDFGVAKCINTHGSLKSIVGSAYYVAPEVLDGEYDEYADQWAIGVTTFLLLSGEPPFKGKNNKEIFLNASLGVVKFDQAAWKRVSREAQSFVRNMLVINPRARMSLREAIDHPWLKEANALLTSQGRSCTPKDLSSNIAKFLDSSILQQCLYGLASTLRWLPDDWTENMMHSFIFFDGQRRGLISVQNLADGLTALRQPLSDDRQEQLAAHFSQETDVLETADDDSARSVGDSKIKKNTIITYSQFMAISISTELISTFSFLGRVFAFLTPSQSKPSPTLKKLKSETDLHFPVNLTSLMSELLVYHPSPCKPQLNLLIQQTLANLTKRGSVCLNNELTFQQFLELAEQPS